MLQIAPLNINHKWKSRGVKKQTKRRRISQQDTECLTHARSCNKQTAAMPQHHIATLSVRVGGVNAKIAMLPQVFFVRFYVCCYQLPPC